MKERNQAFKQQLRLRQARKKRILLMGASLVVASVSCIASVIHVLP